MTLLLNLIGPSGIHQSSDYRLTDIVTRRPVEDAYGSKQLEFSFASWTAQISFTGIAEVGGRKTRDWISQSINGTPQPAEVPTVMANLATRATNELRAVPRDSRQLTIVGTVSETGRPARVFVVSRADRPGGPPLGHALDQFVVYEFSSDKPQVFIFGLVNAVARADIKLLKNLNRGGRDPAEIRAALAEINSRSAKRSGGLISEGCLVTTVLPDGNIASENFGLTPGIPAHMTDSKEIAELIARSFPGKRPVFVQSRRVRPQGKSQVTTVPMNTLPGSTIIVKARGKSMPLFVTDPGGNTYTRMPGPLLTGEEDREVDSNTQLGGEIGEPRTIAFLSPTTSAPIIAPDGSRLGSITLGGVTGTVTVRKNQLATAALNTITIQMDPSTRYEGEPFSLLLEIPNIPTVDGVQPRSWVYAIDVRVERTYSFSIRRNSMAFRSTNYKSTMSMIGTSEELKMAAPRNRLLLRVSADNPTASGDIEAGFLMRDFSEQTPSTADPPPRVEVKAGRNSPCPCGSGKKHKKCCGTG